MIKSICWLTFFLSSTNLLAQSFTLTQYEPLTDATLIGLHVLTDQEVWISGTNSTLLHTVNGGSDWEAFRHPTNDSLQFRDLQVMDHDRILLLSSGQGSISGIYITRPVSGEWTQTYQMDHPDGFLDCMDFWDDLRGIAYGDAIDTQPFILLTKDGGQTWSRALNLPDAGPGEGGFAASGTCVETGTGGSAWIGTGAGGHARVLYTNDYGKTWGVTETSMIKGPSAGITSIRFEGDRGFFTGGDLNITDYYTNNLFLSTDGGLTWEACAQPITTGAFYGSAILGDYLLVTGPKGADLSINGGKSWESISTSDLWTVDLLASGVGWMAGRKGVILRIRLED